MHDPFFEAALKVASPQPIQRVHYFRAMRYQFTASLLVATMACLAQGKTLRPEPHWNYLDIREIATITNVKVMVGDSVTQESTGASACLISVPDMRKDHYVLALKASNSAGLVGDMSPYVTELPAVFRDSVMKRMRQVVTDLYTPMMERETRFKVSRAGKAIEMLEGTTSTEDPRPGIVEAVKELQTLSRENKRCTAQQLEAHREQMVDSLYDAFAHLQTTNLDQVLEPFANAYPENGSTRQPSVLKNVGVPGLGEVGDLPALMESGLDDLSDKTMTARIVTTADADALLKILLARDPKSKLKKQDISLVKETVFTVDRGSGWLTKATTEWRLRLGTTTSRVNSATAYTAIKP